MPNKSVQNITERNNSGKLGMSKNVICGLSISTCSFDEHYKFIIRNINEKKGQWIVTLNLEMIYRACKYRRYKNLLHSADFFVADGMPLVWTSELKKSQLVIKGRSNGTDLVEKLLKSNSGIRVGVIGGEDPARALKNCNPTLLKEAYIYDGKIDVSDQKIIRKITTEVESYKTELLFVNLGTPKQDVLANAIRKRNSKVTIIGVGGSFDILAGIKPRAPRWMQKNGLEWLFRLCFEPRRLAKRYLIHYPQAVYFLIKDIFKNR